MKRCWLHYRLHILLGLCACCCCRPCVRSCVCRGTRAELCYPSQPDLTYKNDCETPVHARRAHGMLCDMCVRPHRPPPSSSDEKDPSPSEDEQMRAPATDEPFDESEHANGAYVSDSASNAGGGGSESGTRVSVLGNDMTEEACERRYGCRQTRRPLQ
jgi:hypothetical protein